MESIELLKIRKNRNTVEYEYRYTSGLAVFFRNKKFTIHYPSDISLIPNSILAIPFVSNLIQIAWITDSILKVPSLDKDFYECLFDLKKAFQEMFPETSFKGQLECGNVEANEHKDLKRVGMFYSGGVDSVQTFISHFKEDIDLLAIWGSDISYDNEEGWVTLKNTIEESIKLFDLSLNVIHSSFRNICDEDVLYKKFSEQLKDSWWHGIQHGLGLLGHVAPLAFQRGYKNFYIASTHSTHDKNVRCSSHPSTDNCVRFCGCQVVHDGFEFNRQKKIENIIKFTKENPTLTLKIHVCWKTQTGENCCACEKCARSVYGILIERGNPTDFGFHDFEKSLQCFDEKKGLAYLTKHPHLQHAWFDIAERAKEQKSILKSTRYWKNIMWLTKIDRSKPRTYTAHSNLFKIVVRKVLNKAAIIRANIRYKHYLLENKNEQCVYLLGTPTHCNIGDAAIAQAEKDFLNSCGLKVTEITVNEWKRYKQVIKKNIKPTCILLHGGGNFGNLWPYEERMRQDIVTNLTAEEYILMPQTFYLEQTTGLDDTDLFKQKYNNNRFHLFAREKFSYEKMLEFFPKSKVFLTPDIVLFEKDNTILTPNNKNKEVDVLMVLRSDREGIIEFDEKKNIVSVLNNRHLSFMNTDMLYKEPVIAKEKRLDVIKNKLNEFSKARLIITDRLHGMVFAYLAGVPCIVLKNNNYKIDGVYDWLKNEPGIIMLQNISDIEKAIDKVIDINHFGSFDKRLFNNLKEEILLEINDASC